MSSMHAPACPHVVPSHDSKHVTREQAIELLEALHDSIHDPACREGLRRVALFIAEPDPAQQERADLFLNQLNHWKDLVQRLVGVDANDHGWLRTELESQWRAKQEWREGLPNEEGRYLIVYRYKGNQQQERAYIGDLWHDGSGMRWGGVPLDCEVIRWMPIQPWNLPA